VRLRTEVVHFPGIDLVEDVAQACSVREVAIVQKETAAGFVRIAINVIDPVSVEGTGPPNNAVDFAAFFEKQPGQVGTSLARDSSYQRLFHSPHYNIEILVRGVSLNVSEHAGYRPCCSASFKASRILGWLHPLRSSKGRNCIPTRCRNPAIPVATP
jgi:hypothetical protein